MFNNYDEKYLNIPASSGTQPTPAAEESAEKQKKDITNIFTGITKADIDSIEDEALRIKLGDEFTKANTDGDETISQSEFETYSNSGKEDSIYKKNEIKTLQAWMEESWLDDVTDAELKEKLTQQFKIADKDGDKVISSEELAIFVQENREYLENVSKDATGKSGKRTLQDGKYIVKEGDTILDIASDFGISPMELIQANKDKISSASKLPVGTELDISKCKIDFENKIKEDIEIFNLMTSDKMEDKVRAYLQINKPSGQTLIFVGMTREQAEKIGGKTLDTFITYCGGGDVVTARSFSIYQKSLYHNFDSTTLPFLKDIVGDELDKDDLRKIIDQVLPTMIDYGNNAKNTGRSSKAGEIGKTIKDLMISTAESVDIKNAKDKSTDFYKSIQDMVEKDIASDNGAYQEHKKRLAQGKYSDFEKNILGLNGELTEEQIENYAKLATKAEYILPVIESLKDAVEKGDDDAIMVFISNMSLDFFDNPNVKGLLEIYGLSGIVDAIKKTAVANNFAERKDGGFDQMDEFTKGLYTSVLARSADASSFEQFIINNSSDADFIKDITQTVINNMPDGEKKTALQNAVDNAVESIQSSGGSKPSSGSSGASSSAPRGVSSGTSTPNNLQISSNYVSNPVQSVADTRAASNEYYKRALPNTSDKATAQALEMQKIEELAHQMRVRMRGKIQSLKNKSIGEALSEMYAHFDEMPAEVKIRFRSHLKAMRDDHICLAYITGDDNLRNFLTDMGLINNEKLFNHFDSNPVDIKKAPARIIAEYQKTKNEKMYEDFENNRLAGDEIKPDHWHFYQT